MKQEDKQLLLKDLCSRLPYEVILLSSNRKVTYQTDGNTAAELLVEEGWKPYLRPMSSMTEEERKEYWDITSVSNHCAAIDWLNAHHFDYRGLIPKGLAIEVNESNNPYKHE
jgi:hypothetical protein